MAHRCYITFPTTFYAIRVESLLKDKTFNYKMVPVPRSISSSCGTALSCSCEIINEIKIYLENFNIEFEGFFRLEEIGLKTPSVEELYLDE
ncbi:MAG: DUF3343 domain-containing protein [Firmicutes bacterium]|nr:DUF3343 domain-containing protein [Bacillota bacterium]